MYLSNCCHRHLKYIFRCQKYPYLSKIYISAIDLCKKKYSWWPGESWDWFGRKRRKYRQHCPTSQVHPWQDLLWNRLQIMISSFKGELVVQIAIILINSQACWDNRVCCNQYEHQLKCSGRKICRSHQYQQNPQEHGQQTISCSVESSSPGWITLSRLFPTKLMRAGLWFQRKTWDEYRKYTFHSIWLRFRNSIWFLSSIPEVKNFIGAVEDEGRKKLVRKDEKMSSLSSSSSSIEYRWWRLWTSSATPFCLWSISWNRFGWAAWDQKFYETANVMFNFYRTQVRS